MLKTPFVENLKGVASISAPVEGSEIVVYPSLPPKFPLLLFAGSSVIVTLCPEEGVRVTALAFAAALIFKAEELILPASSAAS